MSEYCPECGHVCHPEVGMGCHCSNCGWVGLVASTDPRRDTRNDPKPAPAAREPSLADAYDDGTGFEGGGW